MSNFMQNFQKKLNGKICIELHIANVEFQLKLDISNIVFQKQRYFTKYFKERAI